MEFNGYGTIKRLFYQIPGLISQKTGKPFLNPREIILPDTIIGHYVLVIYNWFLVQSYTLIHNTYFFKT